MELTPRQIVNELDKYIIGQTEAKKVVAVALRNRYRRSRLSAHDKEEITPDRRRKNRNCKKTCKACQSAIS